MGSCLSQEQKRQESVIKSSENLNTALMAENNPNKFSGKTDEPKREEGISEEVNKSKSEKLSLFKDDSVFNLVQRELKALSPTYEEFVEIYRYFKNIKFSILEEALHTEADIVNQLFEKDFKTDFNTLTYKLEPNESLNRLKSRVIYFLGNILVKEEQFRLTFIKQLKPQQIDQLVKYEHIQRQAEIFAEAFYLKFLQIQDNTRKMEELFGKCFSTHQEILGDKGFFILQNGIKAAKFSRQGCVFDKRGIFIFLNYLVRTVKRLEQAGMPLRLIEELLKLLIQTLSNLYPPGQDLIGGDEDLKKVLGQIEITWDKTKEPLKENPRIKFNNQTHKRQQLEEQIIKRAKIAGEELPYLNDIIRENCLKKCIGVASNLKLYAEVKNEKALVRITEKLLFKNQTKPEIPENQCKGMNKEEKDQLQKKYQEDIEEMVRNKEKIDCDHVNLKDHLLEEEKMYQAEVEARLQNKQELQFTISDLVRGKCTFSKIEDIIETIENIKSYVKMFQKSDPTKYRILEIESRFTKPIPISDITLKIALHERIIAELQLTLQSNVATYAFAHKIYELQRSKAFSKIKTVFNYYEEYKKEFNELALGQIEISKTQTGTQSYEIQKVAHDVVQYFEIEGVGEKATLADVLIDNKYQGEILSKEQKILVEAVFDRKILKSNEQRAPLFIKYLQRGSLESSDESPTFSSALFYQIMKDIEIPEIVHESQQYEYFHQYLNKQFLKSDEQWEQDATYLHTVRTTIKYEQLNALFVCKENQQISQKYQQLLLRIYGNNQEMCEWLMKKGKMENYASKYSKAIQSYNQALSIINDKGHEHLTRKIKINKAIALLENKSIEESQHILSELKDQYKFSKQYKNATICTLLLSECALVQNQNKIFQEQYKEAKQIAKMHKINFEGVEIANSQYRIGKKLLTENIQDALEKHLRCAFEEYGSFMHVKGLLDSMKQVWEKYEQHARLKPKLKPNLAIKILQLRNHHIGTRECQYLRRAQWPNIQQIDLTDNQINAEGWSYLTEAQWPNLKHINLNSNEIGAGGCSYMINAYWPHLKTIDLCFNDIRAEGCLYLSKAKWNNLQILNLNNNGIGDQGCSYLTKASFWDLQEINLDQNDIGAEGCEYLSKAQWPNLHSVSLTGNKIDAESCDSLSKTQWPNLYSISLANNGIGSESCLFITKAQWPNLKNLNLQFNNIPANSLEALNGAFPQAKITEGFF